MKRIIAILSVLLILISSVSAIGFGYHVFKVRTDPNFSIGSWQFPTSVVYQFNFPVPDFVSGSATSLAFRLDNGLDYRTLRQDPLTGRILQPEDSSFPVRDYITLYDEFNLAFSQGALHMDYTDDDLFTFNILIGGRFENAYEDPMYFFDKEHREGVFHTLNTEEDAIIDRYPFSSSFLPGTPELSGSRSVFELSLSAGIDISFMKDKGTIQNGIKLSSWVRYSPEWLNFFTNTSDFFLWWNRLDIAWTVFDFSLSSDLSLLSLVLTNSTVYRYLTGEKVPYYIQGGEIWEAAALPTVHVITNRTALTLYGPQLFAPDVYPYVSAFLDVALGWGDVLNCDSEHINRDFTASYGIHAELVLFNVADIYYELGIANQFGLGDYKFIQRFGVSLGF